MFQFKTVIAALAMLATPLVEAAESTNQFQYFDNNITLNYDYSLVQDSDTQSAMGLGITALFNNNIWLSAAASSLISYGLTNNNNPGFTDLYQNKSGSKLYLKGGYAFIFSQLNITPYLGLSYSNILVAYNANSSQQFIFENPAYTALAGVNSEYILIEKKLKFGLETGLEYTSYKSVLPNSLTTLGHVNYTQYSLNIQPSLQYNFTSYLTLMAYYDLANKFAGTATPPSVYYSATNTNSANVISNNSLINSVGLKFGVLF